MDVVGEAFKVFAQYLYKAVEARTPVERFRLMGRSFLAFALEHRQYYALLHAAHEIMGRDGLPHEATDHASAVGQFMVDRVREGMECGMLKPGPPETVAWTIWAHWHGLVSIYHRGLFRIDEAEFRQLFRESSWRLMEGLAESEFAEAMGQRGARRPRSRERNSSRGRRSGKNRPLTPEVDGQRNDGRLGDDDAHVWPGSGDGGGFGRKRGPRGAGGFHARGGRTNGPGAE